MFKSQHQEQSPIKKPEDHAIHGLSKRPRVINPAWHRIATPAFHLFPYIQNTLSAFSHFFNCKTILVHKTIQVIPVI